MTTTQEIEKKAIQVIAKIFNKEENQLSRETHLINDLYAKSMNMIEVQAMLESEFDVDIPTKDAIQAKTIGDFIDILVKLKQ